MTFKSLFYKSLSIFALYSGLLGCSGASSSVPSADIEISASGQNDFKPDMFDDTKSMTIDISSNEDFDVTVVQNGVIKRVSYDPSSNKLVVLDPMDSGEYSVDVMSGLEEKIADGFTYGPKGSFLVVDDSDFASVYGKTLDSMDDYRNIDVGGFPEFFVKNYLVSDPVVKDFVNSNISDIVSVAIESSENRVFFKYNTGKVIGFDVDGSIESCPSDDLLLDYFTNVDDFNSVYGNFNAFTDGSGGLIPDEYSLDDVTSMMSGLSFSDTIDGNSDKLINSWSEFRYGLSDETNNYVVVAEDSSGKFYVFKTTQLENDNINSLDPYN